MQLLALVSILSTFSRNYKSMLLLFLSINIYAVLLHYMLKCIVKDTSRTAELSTWKSNQSLSILDYINLINSETFLWRPSSSGGFPNLHSRFCDHNVEVVILVASSPDHFEQRRAIRETWGSPVNLFEHGVRIVFALGSTQSFIVNDLISWEAEEHDDIVQENFVDHYHNLTLKSMAMLKWINWTCNLATNQTTLSGPAFILKTDDDVFINVKQLVNVSRNAARTSSMIGALICAAFPFTNPSSRYYMPQYLYFGSQYPGYLSGTGYMIRAKIIPLLLQQSLTTPLIHMEDIYVTGLLARKIQIHPENSSYFSLFPSKPKNHCHFKTRVNAHDLKPKDLRYIWSKRNNTLPCLIQRERIKKMEAWNKNPRNQRRLQRTCLFKYDGFT